MVGFLPAVQDLQHAVICALARIGHRGHLEHGSVPRIRLSRLHGLLQRYAEIARVGDGEDPQIRVYGLTVTEEGFAPPIVVGKAGTTVLEAVRRRPSASKGSSFTSRCSGPTGGAASSDAESESALCGRARRRPLVPHRRREGPFQGERCGLLRACRRRPSVPGRRSGGLSEQPGTAHDYRSPLGARTALGVSLDASKTEPYDAGRCFFRT